MEIGIVKVNPRIVAQGHDLRLTQTQCPIRDLKCLRGSHMVVVALRRQRDEPLQDTDNPCELLEVESKKASTKRIRGKDDSGSRSRVIRGSRHGIGEHVLLAEWAIPRERQIVHLAPSAAAGAAGSVF